MNALARIVIIEQVSHADTWDSENGIGHPDDTPAEEREAVICYWSEVPDVLADYGVGQWDGGSTAYDPDGSRMSQDGTMTTRFARVECFTPAGS